MPVQAVSTISLQSTETEVKKQLIERIQKESHRNLTDHEDPDSEGSSDLEESAEVERLESLGTYKALARQTRDIRLDKLIQTPEGCSMFDEMCLRIDINQRYASILPQWKDIADILEVDKLKTTWIQTCVRPKEGLTRAMLEIYMKDGGTLGDVIDALISLELYDVLGTLKEKISLFKDKYLNHEFPVEPVVKPEIVDEKFFSVLKTLADVFGSGDPCSNLHKYSGGLKSFCRNDAMGEITTIGFVQSPPDVLVNSALPKYRSDLHQNLLKSDDLKKNKGSKACKILLVFSEDGVHASDMAVNMANQVTLQDYHIEFFRLNETTLWYEMLTNAEGCCLKWSSEADYIMPILTPKFIQEIHCNREDSDGAFIPTSPLINRYIYTLMRAEFTQAGCKNYKVRPVIPISHMKTVRSSNAITLDPLFNHVWIPMTPEKLKGRLKGLLGEFAKKNNI